MQARGLLRLTIVVACLVAVGCQFITKLEEPSSGQGDASTEPDAAPPISLPAVDPCDDTTLDARPPSQPGAVDPIQLVFSYLATEREPPKDAGVPLCKKSGFALRNVGCVPAYAEGGAYDAGNCRRACATAQGTHDASGPDDAVGDLIQLIRLKPGASAYPFQPVDALEQANGNTMVRITNYNGAADDDDVDVAFFGLSGVGATEWVFADAGLPDAYSPDAAEWNRLWDRQSYRTWTVDPDSLADLTTLDSNYNGKGFVVQHVLVARGALVPVSIAGFPVNVEQAILVGELHESSDHHWSLDHGRLGGDVPIKLLKDRLPALASKDHNVCEQVVSKGYSFACSALDRASAAEPCDALSVGLSVAMVEGALGLPYRAQFPDVDCGVLECSR